MELDGYIAALEREGQLLVEAGRSGRLDSPVPTCPGWVLGDLLAHIGYVHRWATAYIRDGLTEMVDEPDEVGVRASAPLDDQLVAWVAEGHAGLVDTLSEAPPDVQCWTFMAAPSPLAFWARRQAHETAVHRVDAELAAGLPPGRPEPGLAADGVDELLFGFLARRRYRGQSSTGPATIAFEATDVDASWTVKVSDNGIEAQRGLNACDLSVRGPAGDLYLLVWNRRPPAGLDLNGQAGLLEEWRQRAKVVW